MVKPTVKSSFRKYRRGRGKRINDDVQILKDDNKCSLYHLNVRGLNSKKNSLCEILKTLSPKIMGGAATFVVEKDNNTFVKIAEGDNDNEFLITRH